jgi:hypothetical protein
MKVHGLLVSVFYSRLSFRARPGIHPLDLLFVKIKSDCVFAQSLFVLSCILYCIMFIVGDDTCAGVQPKSVGFNIPNIIAICATTRNIATKIA